jgi:glycosyltransferase involved in cell wall biosynthesis
MVLKRPMLGFMSNVYPKISVIIHSFNRAAFLGEAIDSILNQHYPNLELIVIDDNSSDNSWEIIQGYGDRIQYVEKLGGSRTSPVHALNVGFSHATGEVMGWINNKNKLMPGSLFALAEVFHTLPQVEWLTGIGLVMNKDGVLTDVIPVRKDLYESMLKLPWNIQQESTFWRKSLWQRTGAQMDEDEYPWAFDVALWNTKFFQHAKLYHLNTVLGAYRKLPSAQSSARKDEFYSYIEKSRQELRHSVSASVLTLSYIYTFLRLFKPLLRNIPDRVYAAIPLLNCFCHRAIRFQNANGNPPHVRIYKRNPFRTTFPW